MSIYKVDRKVSFSPETLGEDKFGRSISQQHTLDHKTVVLRVKIAPEYRVEWEDRGYQGIQNCRSYRDEDGKLQYEDLPVKVYYLEKVTISLVQCKIAFDAEKYQEQLNKAQQLADELGANIVIKSDYVGFGSIATTEQVFYEEIYSVDSNKEMCDYLMHIRNTYVDKENDFIKNLFFILHKSMKGQYLKEIENPSYVRVNIQSKEAYFVDEVSNGILKDKDADNFIFNIVDMVEDHLYQQGILDDRYVDFVPRQYK